MVEGSHSDSESEEKNAEKSSSDEPENCKEGGEEKGVTEYEKQRLSRIRDNKSRLEALGLPGIASSLMGSLEKKKKKKKQAKRKGKRKKDEDDDEYKPTDVEARVSSSSEEEVEEEEEEEEEDLHVRVHGSSRRGSLRKGKNAPSLNSKKNKKKGLVPKNLSESDFIDDDEALLQAIALSLGNSSEVPGVVPCQPPPQSSRTEVTDTDCSERKGMSHVKENDGRRKRKKSVRQNTNRVQMTEDQVIIHFFQFDEAGKGKISKRDLQRVAIAHDFGWTDEEIADMIHCFDSDGDGKLSLDDFRKIVSRCNMVQRHESSTV